MFRSHKAKLISHEKYKKLHAGFLDFRIYREMQSTKLNLAEYQEKPHQLIITNNPTSMPFIMNNNTINFLSSQVQAQTEDKCNLAH